MDLFDSMRDKNRAFARPLAARMRPRNLDDYVGQDHFLGPGKLLRRMLLADRINSLIFYGPPGCGKTALAHVIANHTKSRFKPLNAVSAGIKEVRDILTEARQHLEDLGERTILFLDEIHRFNRSQQDVLLPDVEDGVVILIGATTQNPFFAINTPLLSRSQIFQFEPLTRDNVRTLITRALADTERGLGNTPVTVTDDAMSFLVEACDGDARRALTALEIGVKSAMAPENAGRAGDVSPLLKPEDGDANTSKQGTHVPRSPKTILFDLTLAQDSIQRKVLEFDPTGDSHYDVASAFIKSLRGSDPDAALYWCARMLESGEDPRFVARRLVIFASEDIGNADPFAVVLANAAWDAVERVGMPECRINLGHAVCYLATCQKSNAAYMGIEAALKDVREGRTLPVPRHLRDGNHKAAKKAFGHVGYKYAHDHPDGWVDQEYVPTDAVYYEPTDRGHEAKIKARLDELRKRKASGGRKPTDPTEGSNV
ncbi:MAG: AAA family ATPase [Planctomycetaceae bacterium]|nr:AAA family ATPase [Planctomycetaceae bacterium]